MQFIYYIYLYIYILVADDTDTVKLQPFMSNKIALEAFFNGELENELRQRNLTSSVTFKKDSDREQIMQMIDTIRRSEIYQHQASDCNDVCKSRGEYKEIISVSIIPHQ